MKLEMLEIIREISSLQPKLSLGQILSNAGGIEFEDNPYYFEDTALLQGLRKYRTQLVERQ